MAIGPFPLTTITSDVQSITAASVTFDTMVSGSQYILRATTDLWYRVSVTPTAAVANADNNHFLARGQTALIAPQGTSNKVTAIRDTADGYASLSLLVPSGS